MRGELFVEEDILGIPNNTFIKRFFVSFPFCGLKWFSEEPKSTNIHCQLLMLENCGWVFGSGVNATNVFCEKSKVSGGIELFPFRLSLKSGDHVTEIRLATVNEELRQKWVADVNLTTKMMHFVSSSYENDSMPYILMFDRLQASDGESIALLDVPLNNRLLCALSHFYTLTAPHGLMIHTLKLVGVTLQDTQIPLVNSIIHMAQYIETVSLAENQLTSKGVMLLCESLTPRQHLTALDLSENQICDQCMDMLTRTLGAGKEMQHLDFSRNQLTQQCVFFLVHRVATHRSRLVSVNFAHNPQLGDSITSFLSLLLYNKPSHLQSFNIAYCGITEMGVKELAMALPFCSTLVHASLEGAFCEPLTLTALLDTMSKVHRQRRAITSGSSDDLCVSVGGLRQACDRSDALSFKSLKVAMPYISDCTALHSVLLRRRLQYANASNPLAGGDNRAVFDKFSSSLSRFDKLSLAEQEVAQSAICEAYPIVVLRLRLPGHLYSVEEVLETLATFMRVDASQFHLLSSSELCAESHVHSVIFTVAELSNARVFLSHERNYRAFQLSGDKSLLQMERTASVDDALTVLEALASKSHPFLRKLGVKQVSIHYPTADGEVLSSDMVIVGASSGGRGFEDHYVPPFSAKDVSQYEGHAPPEDTDDDEDVDRAARLADHSAAEEVHGSEEDEEEEDYEVPMTRKVETVVQRANRARTESEESAAAAADNITRDAYVAKLASRRQLRASNERLILAVRQLYKEGEMTSGVAKFWEGAFGHLKYKEVCKQGMLAAIDPGSNVFHAVRKRLQLCNAMFQRDLPAMKSLLDDFKANGVIEGGTTYIYAQRLHSELVGLQRRFTDVEHVAKAYEQLGVVEEYLLSCGTLGYAGEEMFLAVELRQTLVAQAVNEGNNSVLSDLAGIKHKALLSNLLISREVPSIENKLEELKYGTDDHLFFLAETIAAQSLLNEYATCMRQLEDAIRTRDLDALEVALSLAAYHYFYNPSVDEAITTLNSLARNPSHLLAPIVQGLRENNMLMVERGFEGVHKMGWRHAALDSVICSKIFAKKSKIVQDDSIKSRLIKLCLAIKNGFPVKAGEMMQLLRRATAIGLETDSDMKPYLMILNKHMKKFTGLVKQERAIQQLIDADDIPALAKLLAGRGTGKLVMSAPSAYAQEEWLMHLEECCSGNFLARITDEEGKFDESEVFFTGTLEKAARNEQERVKGWRKRFFVLQAVTLTYLTKAHNGDKKGSIRVLGGGVRKMDPQETGGRPFCLELEEGRDISLVNPDLLDEARRQVRLHKIKEIERSVRRGIRTQQLDMLVKAMAFASDLEIMLDFELMNSAKACIAVLREKHLKRDLHSASRLVPESSRLLELVQLAELLNVDPNIPSYAKVIQLSTKSEVEQCLLRAVGALQENSPFLFRRAFRTIAKLDVGVFNTRQRYILAALILQHCGHLLLTMTTDGAPLSLVYKTLRHALSCCRQLMVETECMDAARLLMALAARASGGHHQAVASPKDGISEKMSSIAMYLDGMRIFSRSDVQNDIHKFSRLRLNSAHAHKGLGISAVFSRKTNASMVDLMSFNSTGLVKSLLKYEAGVLDQPLCVEAFLVLHAIMGDRPLHSLARPRKGSVLRSKAVNVESVVLDLLDAGAVRFPVMRDELYFQLLKQLSNNPFSQSASRGWLLLSLYLHAFHPSLEALPFIKNFICDNVERLVATRHDLLRRSGGTDRSRRHHDAEQDKELLAEINHFVNLASYCSKLVCNIEVTMSRSVDIRTASAAASSSSASIAHITADVVQQIFDQTPLTVELVLMTGSVYQFSIPYGQFSTAFSLMGYLYDRLVPPRDEHHHSHRELDSTGAGGALVHDENILSSDRYFASHVRTRDILALFRGFCLYSVEEANFNEDGSDVDLAKVPVQSELRNVVEWTDDLQWDLLLASNDAHSATDTDVNNSHSHSKFKFGRTVVLRRRNAMATEQFCDEYELFKDQVSARDVAALQALWSSWVQDQGAHSPLLPADHVRLDLVFAEDSRYVNSRLYPLSEDSFHYLLAMQLALCWVDDQASGWGEGDDGVIDNVTVGVRPCYKFFPRHSNAEAHADSDSDADKSVAGRRDGQGSPHSKGGESDQTHDSESDEETERLHQHMLRKIEKLEQGADQDSSSDDEEVEDADEASVQSSEYVSSAEGSVGEVLPGGKEKRHLPPVAGRYEDMSSEDRELLISLIDAVGVSLESVTVEKLVDYLRQFHAVATQEQVQLNASKYRYLLKRAYVQYLMSACPLYGNHFSEVTLVSAEQDQEDSEHRTTFVNDSALAALDECQVLVGVSASGLTVLDVTDWSVLFVTPVWDIQECIVSEVTRVNKKKGKGNKRQSEFADQEEVLQVAVNSLTITFRGERLREIVYMLDVWTRELLGRGGFPQGTEQTEDLQRLSKTAAQAASDASKSILQQYLQFFPNLPRPPLPEELLFSDRFIAAPKSRRELLARERAEEERVEMEMVRLATESQMERNQKQIRQGREEMKRYQSESEADGVDEDSDNEGETDGSKNRGSVRRSKRQNRSVFRKSVGTVELREQISHQRLCAAVCGVSERNANNNVGAPTQQQQPNQIVIPIVPMRVGGLVKLSDGVEKKRSMYRPVVEESRGLDALFEAKPVGLSWNVSSAFTNNGGSNGANGAGTSTKQQQAPMKSKAPSQATIRQSNEKLRLALTETQERRVGGYLQLSRTLEERRSQQTALVDQHTIRHNTSMTQDASADLGESADEGTGAVRAGGRSNKDPYLHGLGHYLGEQRNKKKQRALARRQQAMEAQQEAEEQEEESEYEEGTVMTLPRSIRDPSE